MRELSSKKNQVCKLSINEQITGKWQKKTYRIIRELGYGATGTVYLVDSDRGPLALKIASEAMSISSEVNVLRHFSKVQGPSLGPSFFDVDDYVFRGKVYPFYTMEYINGQPFLPFLKAKGPEWIRVLSIQLLNDLQKLHEIGWIFGDLKPENLLVTENPTRVRWLDVGGMTRTGRSIKEFTEFFDRGYWGLGSRKAESSYDLFSVSMLMINCAYPSRFEKAGKDGKSFLVNKVKKRAILHPYMPIILKGLDGKYLSANDMKRDLLELIQSPASNKRNDNQRNKKMRRYQPSNRKKRSNADTFGKSRWLGVFESLLVASFLLILYILYLFGQNV
ncbi:protein kinase domain-containing protein [Evansella halocellulosilytica]|uniref:protein kinase domain-containing protein n=1 Tax=Evansella halocellulosilytica TaxID=2011013 RepID=UPI000BB99E71|nr:serine/threonine protein kinase [Evansella halocellulosilytica]